MAPKIRNNVIGIIAACVLSKVALAQATISLGDFGLGDVDQSQESTTATKDGLDAKSMEACLLTPETCENTQLQSTTKITMDDIVNLGIIDRKKTVPPKYAAGQDSNASLPSIDIEILFDYDSANIRSDQFPTLVQLAEALRVGSFQDYQFVFLGHTDAKGSETYNLRLSDQRAASVVSFLQGMTQLPSTRFAYQGFGESRLKDPYDPESSKNRRVQLVLVPM